MTQPDDDDLTRSLTGALADGSLGHDVVPEIARYELLGALGRGGMGEVTRVYDRRLDTALAMKVLATRLADDDASRMAFVHEASITARLRHPGIIAVHDRGHLPDGRPWFTMSEVRGRTLKEVIAQGHQQPDGSTLRELVDLLQRASEAVAHAHAQGILHRDLKPSNIMVGEFGEVLVMDWGLGIVLDDAVRTGDVPVVGTPAYMAPEQAAGRPDALAPTSDVYALGATLYSALTGRPSFTGTVGEVMEALISGPPPPVASVSSAFSPLPDGLVALCERCMARDPAKRPQDAGELATLLKAWLDGARRVARASDELARAEAQRPQVDALIARAETLRARAARLLDQVPINGAVEDKMGAWALEDEADRARHKATVAEAHWLQAVRGVLTLVPDFRPAHDRLAAHYAQQLVEAEAAGDADAVARLEVWVRHHNRGSHTAFLEGMGVLDLDTWPSGRLVHAARLESQDRRTVPVPVGPLGTTPLKGVRLRQGAYQLTIEGTDPPVRHLLTVRRLEQVRPARPLDLPPPGAVGSDEVYIPAGPVQLGADPRAVEPLPTVRAEVDAFCIQREPVTCAAYTEFLQWLHDHEGADALFAHAPRRPRSGDKAERSFVEVVDGQVRLVSAEGPLTLFAPDWPICLVSWRSAVAYGDWFAQRTGRPWRLPDEIVWAKAARGVDGRHFPWGSHFEPAWARMMDTFDAPSRGPTSAMPQDVSPYGVLGLGGGVRDWCADVWRKEGPPLRDGVWVPGQVDREGDDFRVVRGGSLASAAGGCRAATRWVGRPDATFDGVGFRLMRWLPRGPDGHIQW